MLHSGTEQIEAELLPNEIIIQSTWKMYIFQKACNKRLNNVDLWQNSRTIQKINHKYVKEL